MKTATDHESSKLDKEYLIDLESSAISFNLVKLASDLQQTAHSSIEMTSRLQSKEKRSSFTDLNQLSRFVYIDYTLSSDDSLHSLSMKFGVALSELKRINCLQNDRDMYALKTLKIPIKPYSLLAEQYSDQLKYTDSNLTRLNTNTLDFDYENQVSSTADSENELSDTGTFVPKEEETVLVGYSRNGEVLAETEFSQVNDDNAPLLKENSGAYGSGSTNKPNKQYKEAKRYFKKLDTNLESLKIQNNELFTKNEQLIPISDMSYSIENNKNNLIKFSNLNLNVRDLLIFACLIVILFPLVIVIYRFYDQK